MFGCVVWIKEHSPKFIGPAIVSVKAFGMRRFDHLEEVHGPQGILARTWPSASMVLWVAVLLAAAMIVHYFTK
jgi:multicomponent Na+:H+ antiporter subunit D